MLPKKKIIPYIPGDGIGPDIMRATKAVIDAALLKTSGGTILVEWKELLAGEASFQHNGEWPPAGTLGWNK